ncbi:hypothetical protein LguiA_001690 [Lonicera macranthoides]
MESQLPSTEFQPQPRKGEKRERTMELELPHLPDEIIDDILTRLPVKSVLRFKSVCKRWLSTISYPSFHRKTEHESILLVEESDSDEVLNVSLYSIDDNKLVTESFSLPVPCNEKKYKRSETVVSNSCNGLVIIGFGESIFLFNPSTRYFAKVLCCPHRYKYETVGLCYDATTNDYKVVLQLSQLYGANLSSNMATPDVASLKSKQWARVHFHFRFDASSVRGGPIVNGTLHWTVEDAIDRNQTNSLIYQSKKIIICYDPCVNVFEEFPSPIGNASAIFCLGVLGGCLCMARFRGKFAEERIEVLKMKEYGVRESWTTLFFISSDFRPFLFTEDHEVFLKKKPVSNSSLFLFTKNREVLLKQNVPGVLLSYNLRKKTTMDLDMLRNRNWWDVVSFTQNLASPVGCEWDKMRHKEHWKRMEYQYNSIDIFF